MRRDAKLAPSGKLALIGAMAAALGTTPQFVLDPEKLLRTVDCPAFLANRGGRTNLKRWTPRAPVDFAYRDGLRNLVNLERQKKKARMAREGLSSRQLRRLRKAESRAARCKAAAHLVGPTSENCVRCGAHKLDAFARGEKVAVAA